MNLNIIILPLLQQYMDEVQRGYTWTPVNGTDYRWDKSAGQFTYDLSWKVLMLPCSLCVCPSHSASAWCCLLTTSSSSRPTWATWCCSCSVSNREAPLLMILFHVSATQRREMKRQPVCPLAPLSLCALQICSRCCPAPLNLPVTCSWLRGDRRRLRVPLPHPSPFVLPLLTLPSASPESTASVCISPTTTRSSCRASSRSCWTFPRNPMNVSAREATASQYVFGSECERDCFVPQVTKASSTIWFWIRASLGSLLPAFGRARTWIRKLRRGVDLQKIWTQYPHK